MAPSVGLASPRHVSERGYHTTMIRNVVGDVDSLFAGISAVTVGDEFFVWTDDYLSEAAVSLDGALLVSPHPTRGLTPGDVHRIVGVIANQRCRERTAPVACISRQTSKALPVSMAAGPAVDLTRG